MIDYQITIDGVDYTSFVSLPFSEQYALDESLDNGVLTLKYTQIDTIFKPYSKVIIKYDNNNQSVYYVAQDEMTHIVGGNYYNHSLTLIEETKLLEKIVVDTNTITQPLIHNYLGETNNALIDSVYTGIATPTPYTYYTDIGDAIYVISIDDDITLPAPINILSYLANTDTPDTNYNTVTQSPFAVDTWFYRVYDSNNTLIKEHIEADIGGTAYLNNIVLSAQIGETYKVEYYVRSKNILNQQISLDKIFYCVVIGRDDILKYQNIDYTITDVVNRLLNICETLQANESPRFTFNSTQAKKYNSGKFAFIFDEGLDVSNNFEYDVEFTSNGNTYTKIKLVNNEELYYDNTRAYGKYGIQDYWWDNAYKDIEFTQKPPDELLSWLSANATVNTIEVAYPSPEFAFTRGTLKECLDQVGGYIHAIPRLENDVIYFDELGQPVEEITDDLYWLINENPDITTDFSIDIRFIANNTHYNNIATKEWDNHTQIWYYGVLCYDNNPVYSDIAQSWNPNGEFRTILFEETPTGDLLDWLEANARRLPRVKGLDDNYIGETYSQNIEQYCTNIDTHADNMLNLDNSKAGTIIEPYYNGYETVRAETGVVRITDDTAIIETEYPIGKIAQLKVGYVEDNSSNEVPPTDITPYVYELAEYQTLSSYQNTFPYSKAYAIYYEQGENNIKGLNFKLDNAISPIFEKYAIINILEKVSQRVFQNLTSVQPFVQLNFQIVYYPIVSARVGQSKQDLREYDKKITSIYNQGANMLDSTAYGENLKGAVMRLGNVDITKTYIFPDYSYIKPVGTQVDDDYYISTIDIACYPSYIKCTYGLSKDFNRLSQYIGIKNNIRMYEISERQAVDRYVLTEDYYVIGDDVSSATNKAIFSGQNVITAFENEINGVFIAKYPTVAICETDAVSTKFALPVVSLGIGNSLLYTFEFKDNYSAGNISTQGSDPNAQPQNFFNVQQYAPYGSNLGKFNNINIKLALHAQIPTDFASAIAIGNALPIIDDNNGAYTLVNFTDVDLQVYKDNREKLIFNHQVHFVSNWDNLIIGSGFASNSLLVGGQYESAWKLYILPKKINKFDKTIDLTGATQLSSNMYADYGVGYDAVNYNKIYFNGNPTATDNGKAWAIVREINGKNELIFGRNIDIINNDEIELPTISLVHDIFKRN